MAHRVWLLEDDRAYRAALSLYLSHTDGFEVAGESGSAEEAEAAFQSLARDGGALAPDLVLVDVRLPGRSGAEALPRLRACLPEAAFVVLTLDDDPDALFTALQNGAHGYLVKHDPMNRVVDALRNAAAGGMAFAPDVARRVQAHFQSARPSADVHLAPRERDVLTAMADGLTQKEIAARLGISPATVDTYVQRLYDRLHVRTATGAVARAIRQRLI